MLQGVWHSCPTTRNEAVDMSGMGNVAGFLYLQLYIFIYIYICGPASGRIKVAAGGTYIVLFFLLYGQCLL